MKRRHNDKKGAGLQLLRGSTGGSRGEGSPDDGQLVPGSGALQQGVCLLGPSETAKHSDKQCYTDLNNVNKQKQT